MGQPAEDLWTAYEFVSGHLSDALPDVAGALNSRFMGAVGLATALDSDAEVFDRIAGAVDFAGSTAGATATSLMAGSEIGAASATAVAHAHVAGYFSVAGLILMQFGLMGAPVYAGIKAAKDEGHRDGFALGFAAGATGGDPVWVTNHLDVRGIIGDSTAHQARLDAWQSGVWEGFRQASALTPEERTAWQADIVRFVVDHNVWVGGTGTEWENFVSGLARASGMEGAPPMPHSSAVDSHGDAALAGAHTPADPHGDRPDDMFVLPPDAAAQSAPQDTDSADDMSLLVAGDGTDDMSVPPPDAGTPTGPQSADSDGDGADDMSILLPDAGTPTDLSADSGGGGDMSVLLPDAGARPDAHSTDADLVDTTDGGSDADAWDHDPGTAYGMSEAADPATHYTPVDGGEEDTASDADPSISYVEYGESSESVAASESEPDPSQQDVSTNLVEEVDVQPEDPSESVGDDLGAVADSGGGL